ncbi:hypothetical protein Taro_004110 [Colocasia esculenta]|uniref:Uncharacterized protein n=1 Tax=Colocasia esculenta TaxID=4460 RepID=A0A843TQR0_COLES|nr:hypothetical protein [Colocasia esculenta]
MGGEIERAGMGAVRARDGDGRREVGDGGSAGAAPSPPPPLPHPQAVAAKQQKERHIVTWSQEEDDLLREQVGIHGTENWTCIAAQFKDRTGRQCRRRWYTYLNVECKKGGWSPEEDMILCEAQKIFGNRWTEIAKVVSGRTDNAVKNRFTTLCKKRAKRDSMTKENLCPYAASDNENFSYPNVCTTTASSESSSKLKKIRYQISNLKQSHGMNQKPLSGDAAVSTQHTRPPFAVLAHNYDNLGGLPDRQLGVNNLKAERNTGKELNDKSHGSFLKRDDPKISALLQQEELLRSLALKVYTDSTEQCLENAWKELNEYLIQNGERGLANNEVARIDFLLDDFKDLIEELRSSSTGSCPSARQTDLHEDSPHSSEYMSRPHRQTAPDKENILQTEEPCLRRHSINQSLPEYGKMDEENAHREIELPSSSLDSISAALFSPCVQRVNDETLLALRNEEFNSPLQTVPLFSPFAEGMPSPKFSASERQFLLSILGLSSPSPNCSNPSQQPSCKRALLHSL